MNMKQIEIRIRGRIDDSWSKWFGNLKITCPRTNETVIFGPVQDDAEVFGLLSRLRDLGLPLLAVNYPYLPTNQEA